MKPILAPTRPATEALQPGSGYAQPFELLQACHERVERSLGLLQRLCAHCASAGADANARSAAADVLRYFDIAAPLHHQDEELHVFPALEASGDAALVTTCATLREGHRQIGVRWAALRPLLQAITQGSVDATALSAAAQAFIDIHQQHLLDENGLVFPAAQARLDSGQQRAMGLEMAARRGLDLSGSAAPGSR